jgi:hypothetical protein
MSQPQIVQSALGGETVVARLGLGGEDELYATPTRTLVYRAEGLLSDESVEEYSHDAERVTVSEGRRKAKVTLDYGLDGSQTFALPAKHLDAALHPLVEGVLKANGILADDEPMERLFRFSELTLVVAGSRVVKHIGGGLWDEDYEEYRYEDVTDLTFEAGSVATSVVLTVGGRRERFKTPNEDARAVREALESALLGHRGVSSLDELRAANEPEDDPDDRSEVSFGDGPDPLSANPAELANEPKNATRTADSRAALTESERRAAGTREASAPADAAETAADSADEPVDAAAAVDDGADAAGHRSVADGVSVARRTESDDAPAAASGARASEERSFENSGFEPIGAVDEDALGEEIAALREAVEAQGEEIRRQGELVERLIEELRRGR